MTSSIRPEIREHIENDRFARSLGIKLLELREGYAKCAMTVREDMLNFHGTAHGGMLTTLADTAFGAACNSYGQTAVALQVDISFLLAVKPGTHLTAEAQEEALGSRVGLYHLTIKDESGKIVASAHATAYRKQEWFVERK